MNLLMWCLLVLVLGSSTKETVVAKTRLSRTDQLIDCAWHSYRMEKGQRIIRSFKRHSDGTFTNDFTRYLDKMKAKDFVEWLASTKREGYHENLLHIAAQV